MKKLVHFLVSIVSLVSVFGADPTPATFTIVTAESVVEGGGHVAGYPIVEQGPGSLKTTCSGEIQTLLSPESIQFLPATEIDANINGEWQPGAGGSPGFAPADFAGQASVVIAQVKGAFRNVILTATNGAPLPVSNGAFDSTSIVLEFPTNSPAVFEYNGGWFGMDSLSLAGWTTTLTNSSATITETNGKQTISLTFHGIFPFTALSTNDSQIEIKGRIVASRSLVPQPEFSGIVRQGDTITLTATDADPAAELQFTTDLLNWNHQDAVRTDNGGTTQFTFQSTQPAAYYRLLLP